MRWISKAGLAGLFLACGVIAASAQDVTGELSEDDILIAEEFAVNNTWFVLYHELGHMLIDQLGIPVLGREEDAVDNIATYALLELGTDQADQALLDATYGWVLSDSLVDEFANDDFYDEHSLDLQRAYSITCLIVGNDPQGFADAADYMEMAPERQESCANDYAQVSSSIGALLSPYAGTGADISVVYDDGGADYGWAEESLRTSGILETTAEDIASHFALPNPITIHATTCGEENAFYDPDAREVSICYELVDSYFVMIADDMLSGDGADDDAG